MSSCSMSKGPVLARGKKNKFWHESDIKPKKPPSSETMNNLKGL